MEEHPSSSFDSIRKVHVLYLVPASRNVGITSVSLGLVRALDQEGIPVGFFKPVLQPGEGTPERSTHFLRSTGPLDPPEPIRFDVAEEAVKAGDQAQAKLLQSILESFEKVASQQAVVLVQGLQPTADQPMLEVYNRMLVKALNAEVIIIDTIKPNDHGLKKFQEHLLDLSKRYGGQEETSVLGVIVNKFNAPTVHISGAHLDESPPPIPNPMEFLLEKTALFNDDFPLLGVIPWDQRFINPRTYDLAIHLGADIVHEGELRNRRVVDVRVVASSVKNMIDSLQPNSLIITPGDRDDVILATCMAALNHVPLAGLALTDGMQPDPAMMVLCQKAFETGLPVLSIETDIYVTAAKAATVDTRVPFDDTERMKAIMDFIADHLRLTDLVRHVTLPREPRLSPPAFMHMLTSLARSKPRRILLPEADDPRVLRAAAVSHERNIAQCVLLGDPYEVRRLAAAQGISLPLEVEILDPTMEFRERYVDKMVELRKHKGMTRPSALAQLEDITVLATMILACGEVDGLVSGARHSTANTVRPALQLIKARRNAKLISSIFFMCLPSEVVIYGDCAINPDPNAEELADIALQSAESAKAFGIEPRIAMLSYSTGSSGKGSDVEKVKEATRIAKEARPDLVIDGPLQFDAACNKDVARQKAPQSEVAGRATVLVFPDLNTGNTTYKAVQRTANVVAVGPMLQGLRRPVNDLSRGALVEDIVYTIALTAIQAGEADLH